MLHPVVALPLEFVRGKGDDGVEYVIRPFQWSLERAEKYHSRFSQFHIFSDDIPDTAESWIAYIGLAGTLWFEGVKAETGENVGFIYLSDMQPSWNEKRFLTANFHAITWDAKATLRRPLVQAFIEQAFKVFKLHRLQAAVPAKYGGAIRGLKRLGFSDEGRLRKARRYNGVWFDVILLSVLEDEVNSNGRS